MRVELTWPVWLECWTPGLHLSHRKRARHCWWLRLPSSRMSATPGSKPSAGSLFPSQLGEPEYSPHFPSGCPSHLQTPRVKVGGRGLLVFVEFFVVVKGKTENVQQKACVTNCSHANFVFAAIGFYVFQHCTKTSRDFKLSQNRSYHSDKSAIFIYSQHCVTAALSWF